MEIKRGSIAKTAAWLNERDAKDGGKEIFQHHQFVRRVGVNLTLELQTTY